jgi:hypothetical protein
VPAAIAMARTLTNALFITATRYPPIALLTAPCYKSPTMNRELAQPFSTARQGASACEQWFAYWRFS